MGIETVIDYETTEVERAVYVCDTCNAGVDKDSCDTAFIYNGTKSRPVNTSYDKLLLCKECSGANRIKRQEVEFEEQEALYNRIVSAVKSISTIGYSLFGGGIMATFIALATTMLSEQGGSLPTDTILIMSVSGLLVIFLLVVLFKPFVRKA